jgi:uncharacterized Zn-finger protein
MIRTGGHRRILSDRYFTDHFGKLRESAKIVVLLWPNGPPFGEFMNDNNIPAVELDTKDLPAYCPNPAMPLWSSHPRVFLDFGADGAAKCPYCGTVYRLKPGAAAGHH